MALQDGSALEWAVIVAAVGGLPVVGAFLYSLLRGGVPPVPTTGKLPAVFARPIAAVLAGWGLLTAALMAAWFVSAGSVGMAWLAGAIAALEACALVAWLVHRRNAIGTQG